MKKIELVLVYIRSLVFNIFLLLWTIFTSTALSPLVFFRNAKIMACLGVVWSYGVILALRIICNIRIEIQGREYLPKEPFIIACKHQSILETAFFQQYLQFPVYVIKKELLKIPFYGWFLERMGMIPVDRNGGVSTLKQMLRDCKLSLDQNRSIVIFPEGTRVEPLKSVKYHSGIIAMRKRFPTVPIVPIALNSALCWPKNSWLKYPGLTVFKILPETKIDLSKENPLYQLKELIDKNSDSLL